MFSFRRFAALSALLLVPAQAGAVSVFLNGTKVDGLTNTQIEKCGVQFDAKGNVQLTCAGYSVKVEGDQAKASAPAADDTPAPARVTKSYFMVTEQALQGMTEFDIEVYINSKFVRRLRSDEEQLVTDITKYLGPGSNNVTFVARKRPSQGGRKSFSANHFFRVTVGEGSSAGDRVMIDNPLLTFQKTAADQQDATQEYTVTTR